MNAETTDDRSDNKEATVSTHSTARSHRSAGRLLGIHYPARISLHISAVAVYRPTYRTVINYLQGTESLRN